MCVCVCVCVCNFQNAYYKQAQLKLKSQFGLGGQFLVQQAYKVLDGQAEVRIVTHFVNWL